MTGAMVFARAAASKLALAAVAIDAARRTSEAEEMRKSFMALAPCLVVVSQLSPLSRFLGGGGG